MNRREFLQGAVTVAAVAAVPVAAGAKPYVDRLQEVWGDEWRNVHRSQIVPHQTAGSRVKRRSQHALYHYAVSYSGDIERLA